ncbi:MAG TPA: TlpA disulfide reductase family protein [Pirellulales bacterium]|nr:TlpA disulfide reductase family protein [Pirellulales bacterium]
MNRLLAALLCAAIIGFAGISGCGHPISAQPAAADPAVKENAAAGPNTADAVSLKLLDDAGLERLIAGDRGKVVVIDAWSTACPPCVRDFPKLVEFHRRFAGKRVACISLSFDYEGFGRPEDNLPRVLDFLRQKKATFDNVLSSEDSDAMYKKLGIASVPTVLVYDQQGKLRERLEEAAEDSPERPLYDRVEGLVTKLLAE